MPRLPVASRDDLLAELELIEFDRERTLAQKLVVNPDGRANRLASLDEWERDIREQLEEMTA